MEYDESAKFYSAEDEDQDLWLLLTHTRYAIFQSQRERITEIWSFTRTGGSFVCGTGSGE